MTYNTNQRRLRANAHIRDLAAEVRLSHHDFIQPFFIDESLSEREASPSLTGVFSETLESALRQIEADLEAGCSKFLFFPVPVGRYDTEFQFDFAVKCVENIKKRFGSDLWLATDVCLCSYTTHGHCGLLHRDGSRVLNHETCIVLADYARQLAQAGADCIAPSDMMDGRIQAIRTTLDIQNLDTTAIMSYSAKFASHFYGPFRDVCKSSPSKGQNLLKDRTTYQMDFRNGSDAITSSLRDLAEGADILMVKPALPYLDILTKLRQQTTAPIAVYHVSGEYAALELLAKNGLIDANGAHLEVWTACKRAGANAVITYKAREAKAILAEN
jgi:porphobilinogen synthase